MFIWTESRIIFNSQKCNLITVKIWLTSIYGFFVSLITKMLVIKFLGGIFVTSFWEKNEMLKGWVRLSPPRNREINQINSINWFRRWYLWKVYQVQCSGTANLFTPVTLYTQQALVTNWSQRMWLEQVCSPL